MIELYNAFIDVVVPAWLNLVNVELGIFDVAGSGGATTMFQDYVNNTGGNTSFFHDRRADIGVAFEQFHL